LLSERLKFRGNDQQQQWSTGRMPPVATLLLYRKIKYSRVWWDIS
jgi:hypothetical protein